ncbi:MAG: hypothetical protein F4X20_03055 [Dehalococcoidia bacterium]|nr:hypothetical protein [Dehalococcoidia bacterium]
MANYWMVRSDTNIRDLVEEGEFVAIGFEGTELGNLSGLSLEQIRERVGHLRTDGSSPNSISSTAGNLFRLTAEIKIGDWVLTSVSGNTILIGLITAKYSFNPLSQRQPHERSVKWVGKVARDRLSEPLRNSLGSQLTVFSVNQHGDEIREFVEA